MKVRIGTRGSDLALWQAHHVAERLAPMAETEIVVIKTRGDAIDTKPLQEVEGKAFFTAEIEQALLDGSVDLAVHSHKDLATESPPGLKVVAVPERVPALEVLLVREDVHKPSAGWLPLPSGAKVGTSAPRRQAQLKALRPDLEVAELRGNVPTRVRRCQEGRYDAIVLAAAGLDRLELPTKGLVRTDMPEDLMVPAPAQGALAIQIRADDEALEEVCLACLHHPPTKAAIDAERQLLDRLGGGCHMPLGVNIRGGSGAFQGLAFLGAGVPAEAEAARWVEVEGPTPEATAETLHEKLLELGPSGSGPLAGLHVALVGSSADGGLLGERLAQLGARVDHEQVLEFEDVGAPGLTAQLARLEPGDVVAVTSQEAARRLKGEKAPSGVVVAAVGPATGRALSAVGWRAEVVGSGGAKALAETLQVPEGRKVLFPCAEHARRELPDTLDARGIPVERIVLYRTVQKAGTEPVEGADVRVYMSPSAVAASVMLGREEALAPARRVGLGGSTCDALQDEGLEHERPDGSGPEAVVALLGRPGLGLRRTAASGAPR